MRAQLLENTAFAARPDFEKRMVSVNGIRVHYVKVGTGRPLYLLHGNPQNWWMWRKVIPLLMHSFELIMPDLRGYGDTDKPRNGYDKRSMAADIRALRKHLGHETIGLVGHDRGGRVAHRYALDDEGSLQAWCTLDIEPTLHYFTDITRETALSAWHWQFLQTGDLAQKILAAQPELLLRYFIYQWAGNPGAIEEEAIQEYLRCFTLPGTTRAVCEDYWCGAHTDLDHDKADLGTKVQIPQLVLWGGMGRRGQKDLLSIWRTRTQHVEGGAIADCGHFMPEEAPHEVAKRIKAFFMPKLLASRCSTQVMEKRG